MNFIEADIQNTKDGSDTVVHPIYKDLYHSLSGAIEESLHTYINAGLRNMLHRRTVKILEMGFGTGLNAFLSICEVSDLKVKVLYHAIEAYPLDMSSVLALNYPQGSREKFRELFLSLHKAAWDEDYVVSDNFILKKIYSKIEDVSLEGGYNLIYYDAFAYDSQPELWSDEIFLKIYNSMDSGGILVTYSSKGVVKQSLRRAGFTVKRRKGAGEKRHMVVAVK